ncbi:cation transporter [Apilactobacillus micheneri]|uniref:Cation transporter n=1 Tax=Apilactobacillus micheneri TaxID=1899430 RepID=A0A2S2JJN6_9LACO|nr:cation transporter [Apilactobacillus micheneri]TPR40091.1 cation transporter [Apilactobacillus micheneri]TPR41902.1 cation transporter [Apilactobacillus micheneri]TPR44293.1 cation transporter [Apilactobacillus micheneri]TPR45917.1 cation transporter [Apilactobacillus micheneri]TPR51677.1 cation transporter [Apilactobacillus micheneri]
MENNTLSKSINIEYLSTLWMLIEFVVALYSGIMAKSILLIAFGLDSFLEIISGLILIWRLKKEANGANSETIEKIEKITSRLVGLILILLSIYVTITSLFNLFGHGVADDSLSGIIIAILSLLIMPFFIIKKRRYGKTLKSGALIEDSYCNVTCAYIAGTVLIGMILNALFGLWWADSVAALVLVYFIFTEGLEGVKGE